MYIINRYKRLLAKDNSYSNTSFIHRALENPLVLTTIILVFVSMVVLGTSFYYYRNNPQGYIEAVLSEAHGMIFDLAVIGILMFWLNNKGKRRVSIKKCQEDIDDIRHWKSEEATYKLKGYIKSLIENGVHKIELHNCHLKNINLNYINLAYSNLNYADVSNASLVETNFASGRLNQTSFEKSNMNKTNFESSLLTGANFEEAKGVKVNFGNSKLIKANFKKSHFIEASFAASDLSEVNFESASLYNPDFRNAKGLTPQTFENVKVLYNPRFDKLMELQILELYPELIKRPDINKEKVKK